MKSGRNNGLRWIVVIFVAGLMVTCLVARSWILDSYRFYQLHSLRRDPEEGAKIAEMLLDSPRAAELALSDFGLYGGSNRGWSSWILTDTTVDVDAALEQIIADESERPSRIAEARFILWDRTGKPEHVRALVLQSISGEEHFIGTLRSYIATRVNNPRLQVFFTDVDPSEPFELSREQLDELVQDFQRFK